MSTEKNVDDRGLVTPDTWHKYQRDNASHSSMSVVFGYLDATSQMTDFLHQLVSDQKINSLALLKESIANLCKERTEFIEFVESDPYPKVNL